jgi:protein-ribulosamine 3-kinase
MGSGELSQWKAIEKAISDAKNENFTVKTFKSVSGGSINQSFLLVGDEKRFFLKQNRSSRLEMFEAEAEGLIALENAHAMHIPQAVCWGVDDFNSYLVLEYVELTSSGSQKKLGEQLAALHQTTQSQFGWHRDNTIGSTKQINTLENDWLVFYAKHRLGYQLELAARHGGAHIESIGQKLINNLSCFYTDYNPQPGLLHGDLWGGNAGFDGKGNPVIFDPAVYFGDREADIAMTELFGGFSPEFYQAYNKAYPLNGGYQTRKKLYNLYHILNHYNMFGGGYLSQASSMISQLNACY